MVNWLAVLVTSVISFVIAMVWYGPLFGEKWMKGMKFKKKDMGKPNPGVMILGFITMFIFHAVIAYIIQWTEVSTFVLGAAIAVVLWLGLSSKLLDQVLWEKKSLNVYWINIFGNLVMMVIAGGILAVW